MQIANPLLDSGQTGDRPLDYEDFGSLGASIASAFVMVWGFLSQYVLAIPIGAIFLTAVIGYFLQSRMQKNIREYEKRKLTVTEVLGPLYGDLLEIVSVLASNDKEYALGFYSPVRWPEIRRSHRFYLIPEPLRTELEHFFSRLSEWFPGDLTNRISQITARVIASLVPGFTLHEMPHFVVETRRGEAEAWYVALVFWKVNPTRLHPGQLKAVTFKGGTQPGVSNPMTFEGEQAAKFTETFLQVMADESDRDPEIVKARALHQELAGEAQRLFDRVKEEVARWAK